MTFLDKIDAREKEGEIKGAEIDELLHRQKRRPTSWFRRFNRARP